MAHLCVACAAPLEPEDGHDSCPPCLGLEHLRESLTDSACMNCSLLPWVLRVARLAELENRAVANDPSALMSLPPNQPGRSGRQRHDGAAAMGAPPKKKARGGLAARVDGLASDMEQIRSLLLALQPGTGQGLAGLQPGPPPSQFESDALSLAASANLFNEAMTEGDASRTLDEASCSSAQGSLQGAADTSVAAVLRTALARLQLDAAQTESAQASAFFRRNPAPATFSVPPSEEYLKELHACWRDTRALSHSSSDARTLAAMQNAAQVGLGRMPAVEPAIASLILAPDEALRPNARCPRPQCRVTDDLLSKAYDAAARMGRIGNSLSHLLLGLSTSLQQAQVEPSLQSLSDASLQAFALMSRELGRTMSTLVQTRRQSPSGVFSHPITPVAYEGLSGLRNSQRMAFGPPNAYLPGSSVPHNPTDAPPEPQEAGGLLGKLIAASAVVPLGLLSLRPMQMWLNSLHLDPKWHRHRKVRVSRQCLFSLSPWRKRKDLLSQPGGQIWHPDPCRLQLWAWPLQGPTHC
ncbi:unnamed protein product [Boreogadus saida]